MRDLISKTKKVVAKKPAGTEQYAIERILDSRVNRNSRWEYLIKWKDFPESENSWQSADNLFSNMKSESSSQLSSANARITSSESVNRPANRASTDSDSSEVSTKKKK